MKSTSAARAGADNLPQTCYIPTVLESLRRHPSFYLLATAAAIALRLLFIVRFPHFDGDAVTYGNLAVNLLTRHAFGFNLGGAAFVPTYIRLPGYPLFLAGVFAIFGQEHYTAVRLVQMFVEVGTALLLAATAGRLVSEKAARAAFLLTALCPFLANYVAAPMTETLEIFLTAAAFYCAVRGRDDLNRTGRLRWWAICGAAIAGAILLRPDGGMLVMVIGGYLLLRFLFRPERRRSLAAGIVLGLVAFAPLAPWTLRNWRVFHQFMPLAPRYANEPGEFIPRGFYRWVKTWIVEYASVEDFYWTTQGMASVHDLPARAFDSPEEYDRTDELIEAYNQAGWDISPQLDAQFEQLAEQRIQRHPLRYYLWLPALRSADMWLRPRTEILPFDTHWWEADRRDMVIAVALGLINLFYVLMAGVGAWQRRVKYAGLLLAFLLLRSLFLGTMENPEQRYTLECYPVVIVFAAAALASITLRPRNKQPALARAA